MLDVDHFKKFNDTHGHDVGDQVLRLVAAKMARAGGGGKAYRYGGEEFTILYPHLDAAEAAPFLEELRTEIAAYRMLIRSNDRPKTDKQGKKKRSGAKGGEHVTVTVSIGVASGAQGSRSPQSVIQAADRALYQAKGNGRNQVSIA
jgi:PleD family two-component response regulator